MGKHMSYLNPQSLEKLGVDARKPERIWIMVQHGLQEFEGLVHLEGRVDRPWSKEELWGFPQVEYVLADSLNNKKE